MFDTSTGALKPGKDLVPILKGCSICRVRMKSLVQHKLWAETQHHTLGSFLQYMIPFVTGSVFQPFVYTMENRYPVIKTC